MLLLTGVVLWPPGLFGQVQGVIIGDTSELVGQTRSDQTQSIPGDLEPAGENRKIVLSRI